MPDLRKQDQTIQTELQSLETAASDQTKYLRLVETLDDFHTRLWVQLDDEHKKDRHRDAGAASRPNNATPTTGAGADQ